MLRYLGSIINSNYGQIRVKWSNPHANDEQQAAVPLIVRSSVSDPQPYLHIQNQRRVSHTRTQMRCAISFPIGVGRRRRASHYAHPSRTIIAMHQTFPYTHPETGDDIPMT